MKEVYLIAITIAVALQVGNFVANPEKYGDIMRRFDEARYQHLDCDCTKPFEAVK